jgi:hypothetical protein
VADADRPAGVSVERADEICRLVPTRDHQGGNDSFGKEPVGSETDASKLLGYFRFVPDITSDGREVRKVQWQS